MFTFRETVLVPAAVVDAANRLGTSRLFYVRVFDDGAGSATGAIELRITGGAASGFSVEREALAFENGRVIEVVAVGEDVRAVARLNLSGSGLLRAVWEMADPAGVSGDPVYRPLLTVRRWVTGRRAIELRSPPLPTHLAGLHLVRLRITDPATAFEPPFVRYVVRGEEERAPDRLHVWSPAAGAILRAGTRFGWEAIPGARVYKLEIWDAGAGGRRVAGVVIGSDHTEVELSDVTRSRLTPGRTYTWLVRAIDAAGRVVAQSEVRTLVVPHYDAPLAGER
ncbi:MAG: hypothetical protein D6718_10015 [Acidobacteria bacterium]|nr:MAG: hypothetical protein D6718_10015 [Acidobacteriota bacterium]